MPRKKKAAPRGRFVTSLWRSYLLSARLSVDVDHDRALRRRAHLHAMLDAAERVTDIPIIGTRPSFDDSAALDVLTVDLRSAATDIGPDRRARNRAAGGRYIAAASAAHLMTEHAADDRTRDRTWDVGCIAALFDHLLALDPAALFRRTD